MKKAVILFILLVIVIAGYMLVDERQLSIEGLKSNLEALGNWRNQSPIVFAGLFLLAYIISAAFSFPIAVPLTLIAGAIFGLFWGTVIVSFGSTIGALLSFLASRHLMRDFVQQRFGDRLQAINDGVKRDGSFYLFTLRLIPVFPFFLINLLMGLTPISALRFYIVSQLGMLAGTIVYVNAGTQLAQIESLSGILSPGIILSFVLLGIFPWLAKVAIGKWNRHRRYQGFDRPAKFDRNLIVIGAGAAGLVSTYIAAAVKAKVTLVEAGKMGGDCLNFGCVPSKALIRSAKLAHQIRHGENYGLEPGQPQFSFKTIFERIHAVIRTIEPHDSVERYEALGAEVLKGYARIRNPWTVDITLEDGTVRSLTSRSIIIATGASPLVPDLPGLEETGYVTSDTLWEKFVCLEKKPEKIVILGGGPIGSELAHAFVRLGCEVTQVERGDRILPREDREVSEFARKSLVADGVKVLTGHSALGSEMQDGRKYLNIESDDQKSRIEFDELVVAVGRKPRLAGFGLEELGVPTDRTVGTNEYLETIFPNILAAGDVAGPYQFTHVASHQAWYAAVNALFGIVRKFKVDYRVIPWTTFIDPEVARVGLNEQEARDKNIAFDVTRYELEELDRAIADSATRGFIKVLTPPGKDRILGVTIVGEHAGDLMAEFVLAMKHGLGLNKILSTIHTYPTLAEANKYVAGEWRRKQVSPRTLAFLDWFHGWMRGK